MIFKGYGRSFHIHLRRQLHAGLQQRLMAQMGKRANQISVEIKEELKKKLDEFSSSSDNLEEVFENREQIEISRFYERLPKSTLIAAQEFIEDQVYYRNPLKGSEPSL